MSCRVMPTFKKKGGGRGAGDYSFNFGRYVSEEEWGYLPVSAGMRRARVCFSIRLLVEQRISSIRDIFILQNLMKCLGKDAPVFLKKKLEVKLVGRSFLLPQKPVLFPHL